MNLPLQLDRSAQIPLQDQLFEQLRQLIVTGRLKPNTRLIATRFLAEQVGVSRRTVLFAYERLISEGYLETRPAIGTFVSPTLPDGVRPAATANGVKDESRHAALYPSTMQWSRDPHAAEPPVRFDFGSSSADPVHALPAKVWLRRMRDVLDADPALYARPAPAAGVDALRRVIADYLAATRGILATPEQVVIVAGRRHACSLVAHLFLRRSSRVVIEAPCDAAVADFFRIRSDEVIPVAVDDYGLDVDLLPSGPAALAYVTPARQDPLGGTMPPSRRTALIEWARAAGAYVIEDDRDGELRYQGVAHPPLAAVDPYGLVFHSGTFANTLGDGLGIGYLLAPPEFSASLAAIKTMGMENGQSFEQVVVASLIAGGEYDHHLRRLRKTYLERRDCLMAALKTGFGDVELMGTSAGTRLTWLLREEFPRASQIVEAAAKFGVRLTGVTDPVWQGNPYYESALVLNYAALAPDKLREGVSLLARAIKTIRY
jgi:GntR family transcriptional regulator/MocR family aminotransferase